MACDCSGGVNIFSQGAGMIVSIDTDSAVPFHFAVDGKPKLFNYLKGIVTSVGVQGQGGYQFMHALRELIYVYIFTERVGEIVVNGLVFPDSCDPQGPQQVEDDCVSPSLNTGLERIMRWYECNRITSRRDPITISLGTGIAYDSFLVSVKADVTNAETGVAQFSLRFNYIPDFADDDDLCFTSCDDCIDIPCGPQDGPQGVMLVGWEDIEE